MRHYLIVGSGPSGVIAAKRLLKKGAFVTLLDIGADLNGLVKDRINVISKTEPSQWRPDDINWFAALHSSQNSPLPTKALFGDEFMYDFNEVGFKDRGLFDQYPSQALGGLSRVWGSATMRLHPHDYQNWPITNLVEHYKYVEGVLPIAGENDALSVDFGSLDRSNKIERSGQINSIYDNLITNRDFLNSLGITFGGARLSIQSGCTYCGQCLVGCPYGKIFSSDTILRDLMSFKNFSYKAHTKVIYFKEINNQVTVFYRRNGVEESIICDRLLLGSGALSSAKIIMKSLPHKTFNILMKDSRTIIFPFLGPSMRNEIFSNTLAKIFLEIKNKDISKYNIHSQLYGFNEMYYYKLLNSFGPLKDINIFKSLARLVSRRIITIQSYLHSNESPGVRISLVDGKLKVTPEVMPSSEVNIEQLLHKTFSSIAKKMGLISIPYRIVSQIGRGYHSGSTFPISEDITNPARSDLLGRPLGLKLVHLIDSSSLPEIPSGTITLTVMANSSRIASEIALFDGLAL